MADTRVLDVDEDLIGTRLGDGNLLVFDGTAGGLDDLGPLLGGDLGAHVDLRLRKELEGWIGSGGDGSSSDGSVGS